MFAKVYTFLLILVLSFVAAGCSPRTVPTTPASPSNTPVVDQPTVPPPTSTRTALPVPATLTPSPTATPVTGIDELVSFIEDLAGQDQFSGAMLIGRDDEVLWEYAHGLADREANIPNRVDTQFNLGSMNKMFTAVAILQLVEQGKLSLDDTVAEALPDYPNPEIANQITIHQLLTHTSGLGDVFTEEFNADPNRYRSLEDFLSLFFADPLEFPPGQAYSYSNAGYVVLGMIIEKVSSQSYDDYVRLNIYEPSGMTDTRAYDIEEEGPNLAIGYTSTDINGNPTGVLASNRALMPGRGFPAGGGYSTVEDLFMFRNALLGYQLLTQASTELLLTGTVEVRENVQYAYGFFDRQEAGGRMVGHTGGAPGVCSFLSMYLDTGYTVAVLSNSDDDCVAVLTYLRDNPIH